MSLFGLLNHLLNFVLPAVCVGILLAIAAPLAIKKSRPNHSWLKQGGFNSLAGLLALTLGLVVFGRDGKMMSYGAMLLACASCQWAAARAWRD